MNLKDSGFNSIEYSFFNYLKASKIMIFVIISISLIIGCIFIIITPDWYKAQILIIPSEKSGKKLYSNLSLLQTILGLKTLSSHLAPFNTLNLYVESDVVIKNLISQEYEKLDTLMSQQKTKLSLTSPKEFINKFKKRNIHTFYKSKSGVLVLEINVPNDPKLCKDLVLSLYHIFEKEMIKKRKSIINKQTKDLKTAFDISSDRLADIEEAYIKFRTKNKDFDNPKFQLLETKYRTELEIERETYNNLNKQLLITQIDRLNQELFYYTIEKNVTYHSRYNIPEIDILLFSFIAGLIISLLYLVVTYEITNTNKQLNYDA